MGILGKIVRKLTTNSIETIEAQGAQYSPTDAPVEVFDLVMQAIHTSREYMKENPNPLNNTGDETVYRFRNILNSGAFSKKQHDELHLALHQCRVENARQIARIFAMQVITNGGRDPMEDHHSKKASIYSLVGAYTQCK